LIILDSSKKEREREREREREIDKDRFYGLERIFLIETSHQSNKGSYSHN
jgi:hypothetical protein